MHPYCSYGCDQAFAEPLEDGERIEQIVRMLNQPGTLRLLESYAAIPDHTIRALFLKWLGQSPGLLERL
jgi:hypothetical protein